MHPVCKDMAYLEHPESSQPCCRCVVVVSDALSEEGAKQLVDLLLVPAPSDTLHRHGNHKVHHLLVRDEPELAALGRASVEGCFADLGQSVRQGGGGGGCSEREARVKDQSS